MKKTIFLYSKETLKTLGLPVFSISTIKGISIKTYLKIWILRYQIMQK